MRITVKKAFAFLLTLVMLMNTLPMSGFADGSDPKLVKTRGNSGSGDTFTV